MLPFQQIGPPRNVTVEYIDEDYLISWDPPEYGHDLLTVYVVRWYLEPDHHLQGQIETRNNYYKSKKKNHFLRIISQFSLSVTQLDNDKLYIVTVHALSTNGYEAPAADRTEILTPTFRKMQAFIVGSTVALLLLLAVVGITLYVKRHLFSSYHNDEKI